MVKDYLICRIIQYRLLYPLENFLTILSLVPSELLLISGDFNIHVDVPTDADGIRFRDLSDSMRLLQHVKRLTRFHGHTFDLLITRQSDDIITEEPETERYFSDHAVVLSHLRRTKPTSTVN